MAKLKKFIAMAFLASYCFFSSKAVAQQDFTMQLAASSYRNAKETSLGFGFAAKKPLSENIKVGFDLSLALSKNSDPVESYQFWLAVSPSCPTRSLSLLIFGKTGSMGLIHMRSAWWCRLGTLI